jgi:tRNA threonylcarbamoyladenosine biosynthesis protein TsaE
MSADELPHTGLSDYLDDHTVVAIEWAERAGGDLPGDRLEIRLSHVGNATRQFTMNALGSRSQRLLSCVRDGHLEDAR